MVKQEKRLYEFGSFRLDTVERVLLRGDDLVPLAPKAFDTLLALVERRGHLVEKDELMRVVWPDVFVEEGGLTRNISVLRKALGEADDGRGYIETVPRRGYRFVADVTEVADEPDELIIEKHTHMRIIAHADEQAVERGGGVKPSAWWKRRLPEIAPTLALASLLAVLLVAWFAHGSQEVQPVIVVRSVAVLPLEPIAGGSGDDYLGPGITDTLISKLSTTDRLVVRPTSAVLRYSGSQRDPLAAGRELRVEAVLDGRIQRAGERIRVSMQLVRVSDGATLWGGTFDEKLTDLFALQDSISQQVAQALLPRLSSEERHQLATRYTDDLDAYTLYLKGRFHWNKYTEDGFRKAIEYFEQAIEKDPSYALAYAGVADSYLVLGVEHLPPKDCFPKVQVAALRALELDDSLAEAHVSLGAYYVFYDQNWPRAEQRFLRAIELKPNYGDAYHFYGHYLQAVGRVDEAVAMTERGLELDPLSLIINAELGFAHYLARRYDEAIAQYRATLELDPNFVFASWGLGQAYERTGQHEEAIAELTRAVSTSGGWPTVVAELGCAYAAAGQRAEAEAVVVELKRRAAREFVDPALIALVYCDLGETDEALEWLERAREGRSSWMVWLAVEPKFDRLRSDPRFVELLRRVALEP